MTLAEVKAEVRRRPWGVAAGVLVALSSLLSAGSACTAVQAQRETGRQADALAAEIETRAAERCESNSKTRLEQEDLLSGLAARLSPEVVEQVHAYYDDLPPLPDCRPEEVDP